MTKISKIVLVAGAALSVAPAFAQNPDQSRAYSAELAADAQTRSSLLAPASSGANGFTISDQSGNYKLTIGGVVKFRYTADFRPDSASGANKVPVGTGVNKDDQFTSGFSMPLTRISLGGNIINPDMTFGLSGAFNGSQTNVGAGPGGANSSDLSGFGLEDAWGRYAFDNGTYVKWGQFKLPTSREELVGDTSQLAADFSFLNNVFTQGRSQGIEFGYSAESFRGMAAFSDGLRSANTDYNTPPANLIGAGGANGEADWALSLRGEFKFAGEWSRFNDFTSFRSQDFAAMVGAAFHHEQGGNTGNTRGAAVGNVAGVSSQAGNGNRLSFYTIDASIEGAGWNAFAALLGSSTDGDSRSTTDTFGLLVQGGVFATENCEIFARYEGLFVDSKISGTGAAALDPDTFHFLTIGSNYYILPESHAAKITADAVISLTETTYFQQGVFSPTVSNTAFQTSSIGTVGGSTNSGVLGASDAGEIALRLQFQLLF